MTIVQQLEWCLYDDWDDDWWRLMMIDDSYFWRLMTLDGNDDWRLLAKNVVTIVNDNKVIYKAMCFEHIPLFNPCR